MVKKPGLQAIKKAFPHLGVKCLFCYEPITPSRRDEFICRKRECVKARNAALHRDYRSDVFQTPLHPKRK